MNLPKYRLRTDISPRLDASTRHSQWKCSQAFAVCVAAILIGFAPNVNAQSVGLPAPRLLTISPPGIQAGTSIDVRIGGDAIDTATALHFSNPKITAIPKLDEKKSSVPSVFTVSVASDVDPGLYEARVDTQYGMSTSRIFSVGSFPEINPSEPSTSPDTALQMEMNSIVNSHTNNKSINYYRLALEKGARVALECLATGIDSKLNPVLVLAAPDGRDLVSKRGGEAIDFEAETSGEHLIKIHDLTYKGGPEYFFRLVARRLDKDQVLSEPISTQAVNAFSWPPFGTTDELVIAEVEPNNSASQPHSISLPCDITGSFFPAADIDRFQFDAKKGETWWIEVASERLGRPTDPTVIVQRVSGEGEAMQLTDVLELSDIPSPVKVSSNGYAYDGPPYQPGSTDVLGKFDVPEDGRYQLQVHDLFGGTRSDKRNRYRLVIRQAQPDFALVAWALHMELRNGDRNALSKPLALRPGATIPLEVIAFRRDGFNEPIEMVMEGLPDGVTATGLTIPAGKSRGIMLVTADEGAPRGVASAKFIGRSKTDAQEWVRECRVASMAWPVKDAWSEIPSPRLLLDVPVSVGDIELAPLTIEPRKDQVHEVVQNQSLTLPLVLIRRSEFSGASVSMKTFGNGFESNPAFDLPLTQDAFDVTIDLAKLKTPPGEYKIAFYGGAVVKYTPASNGKTDAPPKPTDIVDIAVSKPISIRVLPEPTP